jgi:hypothetical protein
VRPSRVVRSIAVLPLVVVLVAVGLVGRTGRTRLTEVLADYVAAGYVVQEDNQLLWNISTKFLSGTPYDGNLVVNASPEQNALNVYVLRADPRSAFPGIDCNCRAFAKDGVIVCDTAFVEYFRHLLEDNDPNRGRSAIEQSVVRSPAGDSVFVFGGQLYPVAAIESVEQAFGRDGLNNSADFMYQRFSYALLQWIIGHEIGHVVLTHGMGAHNYQSPEPSRQDQPLRTDDETKADLFMIQQIGDPLDAAYTWLVLGSVIDTLYGQLLDQQHPGWGGVLDLDPRSRPPITLANESGKGHPPLLLRAIEMHKRLVETGAVVDQTGFADAVRGRITLIPKGPVLPTLCDIGARPRLDVAVAVLAQGPSG